jgi:hypothetical protein
LVTGLVKAEVGLSYALDRVALGSDDW